MVGFCVKLQFKKKILGQTEKKMSGPACLFILTEIDVHEAPGMSLGPASAGAKLHFFHKSTGDFIFPALRRADEAVLLYQT